MAFGQAASRVGPRSLRKGKLWHLWAWLVRYPRNTTCMCSGPCDSSAPEAHIEVMLDGQPVGLPPQRRSLTAIRSYLETLALEQQRILWSFKVEGEAAGSARQFLRVTGQTIGLAQMPLQLVENAIQQTGQAHAAVQRAVSQVMINEAARGAELWWSLAQGLKQPLLTLSLLPEAVCGPANGSASPMQLRRWQLEQLAGIIWRAVYPGMITPAQIDYMLEQIHGVFVRKG